MYYNTTQFAPIAVAGGLSFVGLTSGGGFTCGLVAGGGAYCWGKNDWGIGVGTGFPGVWYSPSAVRYTTSP